MTNEEAGSPVTDRASAPLGLILGLLGILLWQGVLFANPQSSPYEITASGGVLPWQREFVYFLYYLNLFPIVTETTEPLVMSEEGARQIIATEGHSLVMDRYWTVRYGERLKTYLYLPHCYLVGSARPLVNGRPRIRMQYANGPAFIVALMGVFAGFWWIGETALGSILVLLLGSNPFQLTEVYSNNNVFGWSITATLLVLALHLPLLGRRRPPALYCLVVPLATGLLLATIRQIRTEPVMIIVAAGLSYLFCTSLRLRMRLLLVGLLTAAFACGCAAWTRYFDHKFLEAYEVVKKAGGHPYDGSRQGYHFFWHSIWCGLGDFDTKYGYAWSDVAASEWALGVMRREYRYEPQGNPPLKEEPIQALSLRLYWDRDRKYLRTPFEDSLYIQVVRDKVLHDIRNDVAWYGSIVGKRLLRILAVTTPPSLCFGQRLVSLPDWPIYGVLVFPAVVLLLRRGDALRLKLIVFTLPLSSTALLVYSGGGTPFYNVYHLVAFAVLLEAGQGALRPKLGSFWRRISASAVGRRVHRGHRVEEDPEPSPVLPSVLRGDERGIDPY
jgi:hypothetical protein